MPMKPIKEAELKHHIMQDELNLKWREMDLKVKAARGTLVLELREHAKDDEIFEPSRASQTELESGQTETLHGTMQGHQVTFIFISCFELTEMPANNTRPTKKAAKKYQLVPLQPLQPLPFPPIKDHKTGLVCLNENCEKRRPHSTVYYIPQPHRNPKVGIKCQYDKGYVRTYHREKFHSEIIEINSALSLSAYLPMDFSRIMNNNQLPSPPVTQQATQSTKPLRGKNYHPCEGVNGQTAQGHKLQRNTHCSCCYHLNKKSVGCSVHTNQRKTKNKEASTTTNAANSQTHQATQARDDNPLITPSAQTQASHTFIERLPASEFRNFRSTSIKKQANERKKEEHLKSASNNITMVVWPEVDVDMRMSMVESYSVGSPSLDGNRLLVMFPGLDEFECKDMDSHLLPVKKVSKGVMDIRRFLSRDLSPREPVPRPADPTDQINLKNLHVISDDSSEDESNQNNDSDQIIARDERTQSPRSSPTPAPRPSGSTNHPQPSTSNTCETEKWPTGVLMSDMLRFMHEKKKYSYKDAWKRVFGTPYIYARSTVSTYGRWLDEITEARLIPYTIDNPDHTVKEGKQHFKSEWKDSHKTQNVNAEEYTPRPTKRVKLHK
ncbi:uncharacterized protein MELLADRAFT_68210 [Melampsora larici-populina 98AG31]|uniref:Uncharacterized protein n=1 Tax=Melampsora larici-populina (strain 98AG31 / pathotype 3-4-7) TaxID=747676 RepID=F4S5Z2_MELLP|nr:uncharacterized protein MELLADRAFT_68210 [Melampsora larici-populina 98AG31]EGF99934.1 hypothetical protein MELLADRAFT_68210 [Melampsora larici-populina 98AG31]